MRRDAGKKKSTHSVLPGEIETGFALAGKLKGSKEITTAGKCQTISRLEKRRRKSTGRKNVGRLSTRRFAEKNCQAPGQEYQGGGRYGADSSDGGRAGGEFGGERR